MHLRYCICTLLMGGNSYTKGAIALANSIRSITPLKSDTYEIDLVCMVTEDVDIIDDLKIYDRIVKVDKITYKKQIGLSGEASKEIYKWICDSPTKWSFMSMIEYNKILFLDSDMIVTGPIFELFDLNCPSAMFDHQCSKEYVKNDKWLGHKNKGYGFRNWYLGKKASPVRNTLCHGSFVKNKYIKRLIYNCNSQFAPNGGLILLEPRIDLVDEYRKYIDMVYYGEKTLSGIDEISITLFLHKMGYKWSHIDMRFNTSAYHCSNIIEDIRILHYIGPYKPWYEKETEYVSKMEQYIDKKENMIDMLVLWKKWWDVYSSSISTT